MTELAADGVDARPAKRARLDEPTASAALDPAAAPSSVAPLPKAPIASGPATIDSDLEREVRAGITEYVCAGNLGFRGVLKRRYTDFLVNEIMGDGRVLHLRVAGIEAGVNGEVMKRDEAKPESEADAKAAVEEKESTDVAQKDEGAAAEGKPAETRIEGATEIKEDDGDGKEELDQVGCNFCLVLCALVLMLGALRGRFADTPLDFRRDDHGADYLFGSIDSEKSGKESKGLQGRHRAADSG